MPDVTHSIEITVVPEQFVRDYDPPLWRIIVTSKEGETLSLLDTRAKNRQFFFTLNAPAYATGQVATDDPEINLPWPNSDDPAVVTQFRRLMYAFRRERAPTPGDPEWVCRFGGIIMPMEDEGADAPTGRYTAFDPWQYLLSRPARNPNTTALLGDTGYTYPAGTRASDIAVEQLALTVATDGPVHIDASDSGLIQNTDPLADPFVIEQAWTVGEVWQNLVSTGTIDILLDPIYEPIDSPGNVVELRIRKFAGTVRFDAVMAWDLGPRSVAGISRQIDRLANKARFFGNGGAPATHTQTDAGSVSDFGQWWTLQIINGGSHPELIDAYAFTELLIRRYGQRNISFDPMPERSQILMLRDVRLGDYVPLWATRNFREPLAVDYDAYDADPDHPGAAGYQRCYVIPIDVDDDGVERVNGVVTSQDGGAA